MDVGGTTVRLSIQGFQRHVAGHANQKVCCAGGLDVLVQRLGLVGSVGVWSVRSLDFGIGGGATSRWRLFERRCCLVCFPQSTVAELRYG
jgi:hypothetical protein